MPKVSKPTPNTVLITDECREQMSALRAHCESRFPVGESAQGPRSVTGEAFTELCLPWSDGFISPQDARAAAQSHFEKYAADKIGALYWRVTPEIALTTQRNKYAYYMRLLISDKPRK